MKEYHIGTRTWWLELAKGALILTLASQINIELFAGGFRISAAVMVFPFLLLFLPEVPVVPAAILASPLIVGLRMLVHLLTARQVTQGDWSLYWPEAAFLLCYVLLLALYCKRIPFQPFQAVKFLPLILIDTTSNLLELVIRSGAGSLTRQMILNLIIIGIGRSLLTLMLVWAMYSYGVKILNKKEAERYRQLLLLTADLKNELVLMRRSGESIENSMKIAYRLYDSLKNQAQEMADDALLIAKDIHEVKKEYAMVVKGMDKVLDRQSDDHGMYLREIWETIEPGIAAMAKAAGKRVTFEFVCQNNLFTNCHYPLLSVFRNLIWNAVEAAGSEPVKIELIQTQQNDQVIFTVRDSCGGIRKEYLADIFEPGFSTKINYDTGDVQRGLGLCLVREIAEKRLKGQIRVETGDEGSSFMIEVPLESLTMEEGQRKNNEISNIR